MARSSTLAESSPNDVDGFLPSSLPSFSDSSASNEQILSFMKEKHGGENALGRSASDFLSKDAADKERDGRVAHICLLLVVC